MNPQFTEQLRAWFRKHARDLPWRRTTDPYAIMVSEFMLQQTQVATVVPYFNRWMLRFPTVQSLAAASEQDVLSLWQGLGYYSRARNLQRAAQEIGDRFPDNLADMKRLPGMGDYTAGAILTFSGNARVPIVDANIARVLARLFDFQAPIDSTDGRAKIWAFAAQLLPKENAGEFNAALMELGALICTPKPKCEECPVNTHCLAFLSGSDPARLPVKSPKAAVTQKVERALHITNGDLVALVQRTENPWQGMWILPAMTHVPDMLEMPIITHRYGITRYRVTLEIYPAKSTNAPIRWFAPAELADLPIPSPYRRVLEALS
ncbi:MAG TPA: A/G-specific adenine glycosylase [Chthoniobacterales bacterium]|jgi:A/G-specific adenine glycosylase